MASTMYHNPRTYDTSDRKPRGFAGLNKAYGASIWDQVLTHDDGQSGYGGTRTFGIGGQGGGKSTLLTKFARMSNYITGVNKKDFMSALMSLKGTNIKVDERADFAKEMQKYIHPETCIWRGREFDSWNVLVPSIHEKCYPGEETRPLVVHLTKDSPLEFHQMDIDSGEKSEINGLNIKRYSNVAELYGNFVMGGNNIIYPPIRHYMSSRLKDSINMKRNLNENDRKFLSPDEDYLVERDIFLFEIFEYLYRANLEGNQRRWFTAIIDESHDLFRANAPDIYYWIIECMVDVIVDTRKHNLSLACMTHALNLIDYRILERASHFLWLKGAKPSGTYSAVDVRLIKKLLDGQAVNESVMDGLIGGFEFNRIPATNSRLVVDGMVSRKSLSADIPDDGFVGD
jgi:hypothetical protein